MTAAVVGSVAPWLVGADPLRTEYLWREIYARLRDHGQKGVVIEGLSGIDIALWDIKGKALDQPLWKLLGGLRNKVPAYASGSLRRGLTDDQCATAARRLVGKGFREMKTQLALPGNPSPADEVRRVRAVRDAVLKRVLLLEAMPGAPAAVAIAAAAAQLAP